VCGNERHELVYIWQLLWVSLATGWRRLLAASRRSLLLVFVVVGFIGGYVGLTYFAFLKMFRFLQAFPGLGEAVIERVMYILFAFLGFLLFVSNAIVAYTSLFKSKEVSFLLSTPVSPTAVFLVKSIESVVYASWAFLVLISPMLAAFGRTHSVGIDFYLVSVVAIALFVFIPGILGVWCALAIGLFANRRFCKVLTRLGVLLCVGAIVWAWSTKPVSEEALETRILPALDQILGKTRFAQFAFLPSYWFVSGILYWNEGALKSAIFYFGVILSYVCFLGMLSCKYVSEVFLPAYQTVLGSGYDPRRLKLLFKKEGKGQVFEVPRFERALTHLGIFKPSVLALFLKDVRVFWRDTTQWSQSALLFGLLWIYVFNLRKFNTQFENPFWMALVTHLNLVAVTLTLATITTRFVYPQLSLEGHSAWVLGLSPMGLKGVVRVKLAYACLSSLLVTLSLILVSTFTLKLPWYRTIYFLGVTTVMTITLNALARGIAMLYPNFKETNPSKIVNGFGGALCLVLSCLYVFGSFVCLAFGAREVFFPRLGVGIGIKLVGGLSFLALSAIFGLIPLRLGYRALDKLEL